MQASVRGVRAGTRGLCSVEPLVYGPGDEDGAGNGADEDDMGVSGLVVSV